MADEDEHPHPPAETEGEAVPEDQPTPLEIPPAGPPLNPLNPPEPNPETEPEPTAPPCEPPPQIDAAPQAPPVPPLVVPQPQPPRESAPIVAPAPPRRPFRPWRVLRRALLIFLALVVVGPPLAVLVYKVVPPPITWLMVDRLVQGQGLHKHWTSLGDIDPSLPNAVIAAEDQRFCEHHGFDFQAMQAAMRANERHPGKLRGGSTISQQTAKNVFLWPGRDYVRKGLEAYFTVLTEALWGKRRIMEMYLNVAEWGPGTYGADAAAHRYFNEPASDIDPGEAAHLAAILPSPLKWKAVNPGRYVQKRSNRIGAAAGAVRRDGLASCLR